MFHKTGLGPVGADEEWRRLEPALKAIRAEFPDITISIDTYWPSIVQKAFGTIGKFIVNDVTAGEGMYDKVNADECGEMLLTAGELGLTFAAMHMRGNPKTMQTLTGYDDVTEDVVEYFRNFSRRAERLASRTGFWTRDSDSRNHRAELPDDARTGQIPGVRQENSGRHLPQEHDIQEVRHNS